MSESPAKPRVPFVVEIDFDAAHENKKRVGKSAFQYVSRNILQE